MSANVSSAPSHATPLMLPPWFSINRVGYARALQRVEVGVMLSRVYVANTGMFIPSISAFTSVVGETEVLKSLKTFAFGKLETAPTICAMWLKF